MAAATNVVPTPKPVRCAIYTRKSTDEGLNQEFNSLDAQREAAEAYIGVVLQDGEDEALLNRLAHRVTVYVLLVAPDSGESNART